MEVLTVVLAIIGGVAAIVQIIDFILNNKKKEKNEHVPRQEQTIDLIGPDKFIPNNLPGRGNFVGREKEKALVLDGLSSHFNIMSIEGLGGTGKTTLALEVAYDLLESSNRNSKDDTRTRFDGIVWVSTKDRAVTYDQLLDTIAQTLGYTSILKLSLEEKQARVLKLFRELRLLLVFDNIDTINDQQIITFLRNLSEPSKVIFTTRIHTSFQAWIVQLEGLTEDDGLELIRSEGRRLGLKVVEKAENAYLLELFRYTKGLPLAIKWAIGQIKQKGQSIDTILFNLKKGSGEVFDMMFTHSWSLLSEDAQTVLCVLAAFDAPALLADIEAGSELLKEPLLCAIGQLVEMSLVSTNEEIEASKKSYSLHPLTRSFAKERVVRKPQFYDMVYNRLAIYYKKFSEDNGGPNNLTGYDQLEPELPNLIKVLNWCWDNGEQSIASIIFENISHFLVIRGYWNKTIQLAIDAIRHSEQAGDYIHCARFHSWPLSWIALHRGEIETANEHDRQAMQILEDHPSNTPLYFKYLFYTKRNVGKNATESGQYDLAKMMLTESLDYFESSYSNSSDERILYCATTSDLARVYFLEKDYDTSWSLCEAALPISEGMEDVERVASLLTTMAEISYQRNQLENCRELWEKVLHYYQRSGRVDSIAETLLKIALLDIQVGEKTAAIAKLEKAYHLFKSMGIEKKANQVQNLLTMSRE